MLGVEGVAPASGRVIEFIDFGTSNQNATQCPTVPLRLPQNMPNAAPSKPHCIINNETRASVMRASSAVTMMMTPERSMAASAMAGGAPSAPNAVAKAKTMIVYAACQ